MTAAPAPHEVITSLRALASSLVEDALDNDNPLRREASACWLGLMKYDDEHATRSKTSRSPGETVLFQAATARLPVINTFINTADADELRHVLEGMVIGLDNRTAHPEPQYMSNPYSILLFADLVADISQQDDPVLRQRAGRRIGTLKHDIEHGLRNWGYSIAEHRYLGVEVAMIDELTATANTDQLRDIIHGFTKAMPN